MDEQIGWRVIWYGPTYQTHSIYPVTSFKEAYTSAYICINRKDLKKPLVYYGTKRLGA